MILYTFTNNVIPFIYGFFIYPCKRCNKRKSDLDNDIVDSLTMGGFYMEWKIPKILNISFVCLLYSGGMPLLYFVGFLSLLITYSLDVFYIFRVKKPPFYNSDVIDYSLFILPISILLHFGFSCWMIGYPELFYNSKSGKGVVNLSSWINEDPFGFLPRVSSLFSE